MTSWHGTSGHFPDASARGRCPLSWRQAVATARQVGVRPCRPMSARNGTFAGCVPGPVSGMGGSPAMAREAVVRRRSRIVRSPLARSRPVPPPRRGDEAEKRRTLGTGARPSSACARTRGRCPVSRAQVVDGARQFVRLAGRPDVRQKRTLAEGAARRTSGHFRGHQRARTLSAPQAPGRWRGWRIRRPAGRPDVRQKRTFLKAAARPRPARAPRSRPPRAASRPAAPRRRPASGDRQETKRAVALGVLADLLAAIEDRPRLDVVGRHHHVLDRLAAALRDDIATALGKDGNILAPAADGAEVDAGAGGRLDQGAAAREMAQEGGPAAARRRRGQSNLACLRDRRMTA